MARDQGSAIGKQSSFSLFRLKTVTGKPCNNKRPAMPEPVVPSPRIATRGFAMMSLF